MFSKKDSIKKYTGIKEQTKNIYNNNITIIIYNKIKLHQIVPISCAANIYSQLAYTVILDRPS